MKKGKDPFNPAFKDLHLKLKSSQKVRNDDPDTGRTTKAEQDDKKLFRQAMSDVIPLPGESRKAIRFPGANIRPAHPAPNDEREAMTHLIQLVKGSIELDVTFTDEYMEGSVRGFSQKLMKRLRKGEFPVQDYIDLHGLTKEEAETKVRDFLVEGHRHGLRSVLIVHGRGLNSPDSFPVLKENLPIWLSRGPVKKIVLAFATARPYDGGTGAVYVLLRKR